MQRLKSRKPPTHALELTLAGLGIVGDQHGMRHWKTEVVARCVEILSGRRKRDYEVEPLAVQATGEGGGDTLEKRSHSSTPAGPFRAACHGTIKP